jgi:type I restriction-modification system DNA methylase subunit
MANDFPEELVSAATLAPVVDEISRCLENGETIGNKKLIAVCRRHGIELIEKGGETHLLHEIFETAVNEFLVRKFDSASLANEAGQTLDFLENLSKTFPPQSWRGAEQMALQQFSTPPAIAFVMATILNAKPGETVVEPSAGTGDLATWLKIAGLKNIIVNEISPQRREFLKIQNYQPFAVNAEFLNDLLPVEIEPDVCLMNPPFSTSAGRTVNKDSNFGFRHISAALKRLKNGGRLVALLSTEAAFATDKGKKFWHEIVEDYDVRAIINLPRKAYYKYGTSIKTSIIAIQKRRAEKSSVQKFDCENLRQILKVSKQVFQN